MPTATDQIDFLVNLQTGDLDLSGGKLNTSRGLQAIAQGAMIRAKQIKGEWFRNKAVGVPYIVNDVVSATDALLGAKFDRAKTEAAFRKVLETTPGVVRVLLLAISFDSKSRRVRATWRLRTAFGDTPVQEIVQ